MSDCRTMPAPLKCSTCDYAPYTATGAAWCPARCPFCDGPFVPDLPPTPRKPDMSDCRPVQLECTNCRTVTRVADLRPVIRCPHCETPLIVRAQTPLTGVATALPATLPRSTIEAAPAPRGWLDGGGI